MNNKLKVLTVLTYYRPYTSGLTIYAERLSEALTKRGHTVTVLTMQHEKSLAKYEMQNGVAIDRAPVLLNVSKGVISPLFWVKAVCHARKHDVVHLHLPQFDAAVVALCAKIFKKPIVITYHCDIQLPKTPFNIFVNAVVNLMNAIAGNFASRIVTYTEDYANTSPFASKFKSKLKIIPPPVELPKADKLSIEQFAISKMPSGRPLIGMAARLAAEKGVEVLLEAIGRVRQKYPEATVAFAGQYSDVLGEAEYLQRLTPTLEHYQKNNAWHFLGTLSPSEMSLFFPNLDVLVVPSLNSTESFGMVQIEAMMNGVPVVASDLPGVRQPVLMTGMGRISKIGDSQSLAEEIIKILDNRANYIRDPDAIREKFSCDRCASTYEELYSELS